MNIGWIGSGVMGLSMARHLQQAGHKIYVYSRTREKAELLLGAGGVWCDSAIGVARRVEVLFSIVGFPQDVEDVYLGEQGVFCERSDCRVVVDMTTSCPALAGRIAKVAEGFGMGALDAPVSGGDIGARDGSLAIMVGGDRDSYEYVLPLLEIMGKNISYMGGAGAGQHTKMCNQILIAGTMIGVCESLLYASRQGLNQEAVIAIIGKGAAGSWSINNLGPRIVCEDFSPGFYVEHFVKDMGIALDAAAEANLSLPGLALVHQLYVALKAQGRGRLGTQALMQALKLLNGMDVK